MNQVDDNLTIINVFFVLYSGPSHGSCNSRFLCCGSRFYCACRPPGSRLDCGLDRLMRDDRSVCVACSSPTYCSGKWICYWGIGMIVFLCSVSFIRTKQQLATVLAHVCIASLRYRWKMRIKAETRYVRTLVCLHLPLVHLPMLTWPALSSKTNDWLLEIA